MDIVDWVKNNPNKFFIGSLVVFLLASFMCGLLCGLSGASFTEDQLGGLCQVIGWIIILPASVITLKIKNRSLWWMLLWGIFSPLWVRNHANQGGVGQGNNVTENSNVLQKE